MKAFPSFWVVTCAPDPIQFIAGYDTLDEAIAGIESGEHSEHLQDWYAVIPVAHAGLTESLTE